LSIPKAASRGKSDSKNWNCAHQGIREKSAARGFPLTSLKGLARMTQSRDRFLSEDSILGLENPHRLSWTLFCSVIFLLFAPLACAKGKADLIVAHATIVTMDPHRRVIENGAVAVCGDSIVAVDTSETVSAQYDAVRRIDARGALLLPGLINTHAHAAMSLFRGLADDLSLEDWLDKYIFPAEARNVTEDFVEWGTRLSLDEMLRGGITTYADMYYFEDAVARVTKEAGMRGVLGETIIDLPAPDNKITAVAFDYTQAFLDHWKGDPLIVAAVAPHSIYTCSEKTLRGAAALARKNHAPILIHIAEAPFELQQSREKYGVSPVQFLARIGLLGPDVLGAHCVWVDQADRETLAHFGVGCSLNPSSNMKTAAGLMPAPDLLAAGVAVGIATDGPASNNNQDLFEEMDLGAKLQKFGRMDPRALPAKQVVEMATITGARALHMDKQIGSLEAGKKADFIIVDTSAPHATPMYNVYSQIVYALKATDVRTVVIAGKIVMEERQMLTLDEPEILLRAQAYKKQVQASFAESPVP
jgi:5-methylthioadenosine/S-adenosylhomocysteine deaminase